MSHWWVHAAQHAAHMSCNRREFLLGSAGLLAVGSSGCGKRDTEHAAGAIGAAGAIIAVPGLIVGGATIGLWMAAAGGVLYLYSLTRDDGPVSDPDYKTYGNLSRRSDNSVPAGQVRVQDGTSRDVTSSVFIDPSAERLIGGSLSNNMTRLHYRCPQRVRSLPFDHADIMTLKYRATMFGIPCDAQPTPTGDGRFTIGYGGVDWQDREFAARSHAQNWYRVFSSAPGFEIAIT